MASEVKHCAECGAPLAPHWPKGLCNLCALNRALAINAASSQIQEAKGSATFECLPPVGSGPANAPLGVFGDYELLEEIARGGMGVVYRARQRKLDRTVAVKMILAGPLAGKEFVQRFRAEAAAAAILQHPNIVAIHDVGVQEGRHYFSMDYVEGQNLMQLVGTEPLPPGKAALYVERIAEAIHYAHESGILHRDLKPSNVLIDSATDQPRVTDFGLAKRLDGESSLTLSGHLLGSPNFMPPEQAGANRGKVGRHSDVYALGGILYYLLTARAPFQADSLEHTIAQVLNAEPVPPRLLVPSIPRDLETIALKCLEKEPSRRYRSAEELADELRRFQAHEPILARPLSRAGKLLRWSQRKPALASLIVLLHLVGAAGLAGILWQWQRAERQLYVANLNVAQSEWEQNHVSRVRELLEETGTSPERGFEWFYWQRQLHLELQALRGHTGPVLAVAYLPDGRRIVTGSADHTAKVWNVDTSKELLTLGRHTGPVRALAVSPDGRQILTGSLDCTAKLWDLGDGKCLRTFLGHLGGITSVALSPDGQRMVTGSLDNTARVWEVATGELLATFAGHRNRIWAVAFSPDGQRVVSGAWDGTAIVWEAASGKVLLPLDRNTHRGAVFSVAFSPDGQHVVTGSRDHTVKVWDLLAGASPQTFRGHSAAVFSVGYSRDGKYILSGSEDQTARLWSSDIGEELAVVKGHGSRIGSATLSPDGNRIVTGGGALLVSPGSLFVGPSRGDDQTAKIWDVAGASGVLTLTGHSNEVVFLSLSLDGRLVASGGFDGTIRVWDILTGDELHRLHMQSAPVRTAAFFPDGRRLVIGSFDGSATVWDVATTNAPYRLPIRHNAAIFSVAVSPDGRWIATASWDRHVKVWEADSLRLVFDREHSGQVFPVAFSPDSHRIVSADGSGIGKVWDLSGEELFTFRDTTRIWSVTFSRDGRWIVTGNDDFTAKVWSAANGKERLALRGHTAHIHSAAFSPDGRRVVTGSADQTAKLWDLTTGQELLTFKGHKDWVFAVAFSPDGQRIVTASGDKTIKVWQAASLEQVESWRMQEKALATNRERERIARREQTRARATDLPGGIDRWLVLSPISYDGKRGIEAVHLEQVPHESQLRPRDGDKVKMGLTELVWRKVQLRDSLLDFNQIAGQQTEFHLAYAVCYLESQTSQSNLVFHFATDDQAKVFLNGEEVCRVATVQGWEASLHTVSGIELRPGPNVLVFKVVNELGDWKGAIRITDSAGKPVQGLRLSLTPP